MSRQGIVRVAGAMAPLALVLACGMAVADPGSGYYNDLDPRTSSSMRDTVHTVIDDHTRFPYTSSATDTWNIIADADEDPGNSSNIIDVYKNASYTKETGGNSNYNREHSWPKSYGFPKDNTGNYPYTDVHHLFACDDGYNSSRNNRIYDWCTSGCTEYATDVNNGQGGTGESNFGSGSGSSTGKWETWIGRRGDVARAMFYMDVRYEGGTHGVTSKSEPDLILTNDRNDIVSNTSTNLSVAYMGLLDVLLEWHEADPVDDFERTRNDVVEDYQGNRNPFIDYPEWVGCVFEGECDILWINEFHYDNAGGDTGEFVEICGPSGVNLSGWKVLGYNGADGTVYKTVSLSGTLGSDDGCFGFADFAFSGMQNGPDGLALVNPSGDVVQFFSYEGSFTATGGEANGLTSVDILVSESGATPIGDSLQMMGSAAGKSLFVWDYAESETPGDTNAYQTLESDCSGGGVGPSVDPWINEFHYDDAGSDSGEFVEIAGEAGTDLSGWKVLGYNGSGGGVYKTVSLSGTISDQSNGYGTLSFAFSGMQNGAPDGLALVDDNGDVVMFISYEGVVNATAGEASGTSSVNIGVSESSSTPDGYSLRLSGTGSAYSDFSWQSPAVDSPGSVNSGQSFN